MAFTTRKSLLAKVRADRAGDVDIMIRKVFGSYDDLIQPLEMGAAGLMIPHCKSAEMVREIIYQTKFQPMGHRGVDGISADSDFGLHPLKEYMEFANRETFIMVQIEDAEALDEIEKMAVIPGVDILFIGPADLSHSLGCPGDLKNPMVRDAISRTVRAANANGKWCARRGMNIRSRSHRKAPTAALWE